MNAPDENVVLRSNRRPDRAFTLLEIMLVLALITIVMAVSIPTFTGTFSTQRLRKAGDMVRTEWARARVKAMKTGHAQVYRHVLDAQQFVTVTQYSLEDDVVSDFGQAGGQYGGGQLGGGQGTGTSQGRGGGQDQGRRVGYGSGEGDANGLVEAEKLPDGTFFLLTDVQFDPRAPMDVDSLINVYVNNPDDDSPQRTRDVAWSQPVVFYPDGTTSTARVTLSNDDGYAVTLDLRGLTGITRVSDLEYIGQGRNGNASSRRGGSR